MEMEEIGNCMSENWKFQDFPAVQHVSWKEREGHTLKCFFNSLIKGLLTIGFP